MKYSKTTVRLRPHGWPRRLRIQLTEAAWHARVYPMRGPFLNPVALSNIETYPMICGWSGTTPRSLPLRSSTGTLVTMQPPMKLAQSMLAQLQLAGTRERATR